MGDGRRQRKIFDVGLVRMTVRGPVEHAVLEIAGELDFTYADDVVAAARVLPHRLVSVDLRDLEFADAEGARALERIIGMAEARDGVPPTLIGARPAITRACELSGTLPVIA